MDNEDLIAFYEELTETQYEENLEQDANEYEQLD